VKRPRIAPPSPPTAAPVPAADLQPAEANRPRLPASTSPRIARANCFGALIQGILNETAELAYPATLYADVREWTDLKVRMKTLNRTVPVQVKFFAVPNDQDAVVVRNRRADPLRFAPLGCGGCSAPGEREAQLRPVE
jgi:hypothetical protein